MAKTAKQVDARPPIGAWPLLLIGALDLLSVGGGLFTNHVVLHNRYFSGTAFAIGSVGVITFLGFVAIGHGLDRDRIRAAIAAAFVVTYLVMLGLFAYFHVASTSTTQPSPITDTLVTNFTVLMGVVIAAYFGTTTYERIAELKYAVGQPGTESDEGG